MQRKGKKGPDGKGMDEMERWGEKPVSREKHHSEKP